MYNSLTKLIGRKFQYQGKTWLLVEVLRTEDALVIAPQESAAGRIQPNQFGQATRKCHACRTLPLSDAKGEGYSEEVLELLEGRVKD